MPTEKPIIMQNVNWRLPARIAADNAGDWTAFREHLELWYASGEQIEADPDPSAHVCFRLSTAIVEALEAEAKRLTKEHGKRFTPGAVARLVWDTWEPRE